MSGGSPTSRARLWQTTARLANAVMGWEPPDWLGLVAVLALIALCVWALVAPTR
jgi:hypothetical protein